MSLNTDTMQTKRLVEDLSCVGTCTWKTPLTRKKQQVANRVTASPWRQLVRLYHSPKITKPFMVFQDNVRVEINRQEKIHNSTSEVVWPLKYDNPCVPTIDSKQEIIHQIRPNIIQRVEKTKDNNNNQTELKQIDSNGLKCNQCGKIFVTRTSLKVHSRTHSGEKPFQCIDCGKQFSQLRNYKYHRSVHEGTKEFAVTCPECGKYFNDRGYLSSHMKIHRNRKEYGCNECGKRFNQRVAYNMHIRIHTGVKPHKCTECGKAFSRKMLLKQHLRIHSGERPYQCQVCKKSFADRSNMTLHTRLHSGLKPYQCDICSKAFTKKHHLKTHLNYHTGTKPYSCEKCGLKFSQSSNMRTHLKKCSSQEGTKIIQKYEFRSKNINNVDTFQESVIRRIITSKPIRSVESK